MTFELLIQYRQSYFPMYLYCIQKSNGSRQQRVGIMANTQQCLSDDICTFITWGYTIHYSNVPDVLEV